MPRDDLPLRENDPLISIIVPVFNVAGYVERCIQSLIVQTYERIEIILVDDGSTDGSGEICDAYAKEDSRIVVIHQENGGLSSARNTGIAHATGEYIGFIDGDDYVDATMYEKLMTALRKTGSKIAICSLRYVDEQGHTIRLERGFDSETYSNRAALEELSRKPEFIIACSKLYSIDLFSDIRFPIGKQHEDEFIAHRILHACPLIATVNEPLYYYVQRESSIMGDPASAKRLDAIDAFFDRVTFFRDIGYRDLAASVLGRAEKVYLDIAMNCNFESRNDRKRRRGAVRLLRKMESYVPPRKRLKIKAKRIIATRLPHVMSFLRKAKALN